MIEKTASKYAPNKLASKKKHIYSRLLDYFITFVAASTLFVALLPAFSSFPSAKESFRVLNQISSEAFDYINSSGLQKYNEGKTELKSINDGADEYLLNLTKTSAYVHNKQFPVKQDDGSYIFVVVTIDETFIYQREEYKLDNISFYYQKFNYEGKPNRGETPVEDYQYLNAMGITSSNYVASDNENYIARGGGVSRYVVLTEENTDRLLAYYKNDRADTSLYNSIYHSYATGIQKGIKEVEANSVVYLKIVDKFNAQYQKVALIYVLTYLAAYTISYVLLVLIISLVKKEWTTVGLNVMKLALSDPDEMNPPIWKYIVYHVLNYFGFFSSSLLTFYLLGMVGATGLVIVPHITFLMITLFLLVFNLVSLFMPLFNKHNYDLSTFLLRMVHKDTREFDVPVGVEIEDKKEDGK